MQGLVVSDAGFCVAEVMAVSDRLVGVAAVCDCVGAFDTVEIPFACSGFSGLLTDDEAEPDGASTATTLSSRIEGSLSFCFCQGGTIRKSAVKIVKLLFRALVQLTLAAFVERVVLLRLGGMVRTSRLGWTDDSMYG